MAPIRVDPSPPPEARLEVTGVSKWYGDVVALSDVSFRIGAGVTALLGPNGAGKSTLFKVIAGLIKPSTGSVKVLGLPARGNNSLYRYLALVPEHEQIYPFLTAREFVRLNAILQGVRSPESAAHSALAAVDLLDDADRKVGGFSNGMRQRVKIAAALVHEPRVMILDEPLRGTDPVQRSKLIALIRRLGESGHLVVVSSHILGEVERFSDRILVIVNGKLAAAGDYHTIRDKLDQYSHIVRVRASDPRLLAAALLQRPFMAGVHIEKDTETVVVEADDVREFYRQIPRLAKAAGIRIYEIKALDNSLASVFAYITKQ